MKVRQAIVELEGITPISFSRRLDIDNPPKGTPYDDWWEKTCYDRLHLGADGNATVPAMMLKYCLDEGCRNLSPDDKKFRGNEQWTKYFEYGICLTENVSLGVKPEAFRKEWIWADSNGKKGRQSSSRVKRCYPTLDVGWKINPTFVVLDEKITQDIFEKALASAGWFCGLGRFRPQNQGYYGRFDVKKIKWS